MAKFVVLGLGMMGEAIVYDLLIHKRKCEVIGIESDKERIIMIRKKFNSFDNFEIKEIRLSESGDNHELEEILRAADVAFGAIDYRFNYQLSKLAIRTETHFLDLGGNPEVVKKQHLLSNDAIDANISIIPDCGLAPGMANILAASLVEKFSEVDQLHIRVGGLPQKPLTLLKYQQVFSIRGLTNEYIEDAIILQKGKITEIPSLTQLESLSFDPPYHELEAFITSGGTSSLPSIYEGEISTLTYKTIRYAGHHQYIQFLYDLGMFEEKKVGAQTIREITETKLVEYLPQEGKDVVLIRIIVVGERDMSSQICQLDLTDHADKKSGLSAMARTTAFPISILGQFLATGKISERGVLQGEKVTPYDVFITQLQKRSIRFTVKYLPSD